VLMNVTGTGGSLGGNIQPSFDMHFETTPTNIFRIASSTLPRPQSTASTTRNTSSSRLSRAAFWG
jgi:hypothetical protein